MKVLFIVQGEGRGHLTQAISLAQILQAAGHDVVGALVGVTEHRAVPSFFSDAFTAPVTAVFSPGLVYNAGNNELEPVKTVLQAIKYTRPFWKSLSQVRQAIDEKRPDVVVNFYEMLGGLTYALLRPPVPMICIAHQYFAFHPNFQRPKHHWFAELAFKFNTRLTCFGAHELLTLSFDKQADYAPQRIRIVPPLLRREVTQLTPTEGDFLLAYVTQAGLRRELEKAHRQQPTIPMHGFHGGATETDEIVDETLTYHAIDGKRFVEFMARCKAIVTTAGFESVCEAAYLGKPALMIPQPNHFEQAGNALDGQRAGLGVAAKDFDLNLLLGYMPNYDPRVSERFRDWYNQGSYLFLNAMHRASAGRSSPSGGFLISRMRQLLRG